MRRAHLLFIAAMASLGCDDVRSARRVEASAGRAGAGVAARPPRDLTLASFNVFYENATEGSDGDAVEPETVAAITKLGDADVILFQETNPPFERAIRKALSATHPRCAFHAPTRYSPGGLGFCARAAFDIESEREIASPVTWFPAQHVVLRWGHARLQIMNVHLRPAIGSREAWWDANAATIADRDREMAVYLGSLVPDVSAFIVGDFNDPNHGGVLKTLDGAGFVSALGATHVDGPTWRWAGEPPLEVQLDHVVIDPKHFDAVRGEVRHIGRSDHFPIVAWLRERAR